MKQYLLKNGRKSVNLLVAALCSLALVLTVSLVAVPTPYVEEAQAGTITEEKATNNTFTLKDITFTLSHNGWVEDKDMATVFSGSTGYPFFVAKNASNEITASGLVTQKSDTSNINTDIGSNDTVLASQTEGDTVYKLWSSQCSTAGGGHTNSCRVHKAKVFKDINGTLYSWTFTKTSQVKEVSGGDSTNYNDSEYNFGQDINVVFLNQFIASFVVDPAAIPAPAPVATPSPAPSASSSASPAPSASSEPSSKAKLVFDSASYDYTTSNPTYTIKLELEDGYFSGNIYSGDISFGGVWADSQVKNVSTSNVNGWKKAVSIVLTKDKAQRGQTGDIYIDKAKIVDSATDKAVSQDLKVTVTDNYMPSIIKSYDPQAKDIIFIYDEAKSLSDADQSLNTRAKNYADNFIKNTIIPAAGPKIGEFLQEGLKKVVSFLSTKAGEALNGQKAEDGTVIQQPNATANWIFNKAAGTIISLLPVNSLLQSVIGAVANYFIDLMFDVPFVYRMEKTGDVKDPTQLDNVQSAISDLSTQLSQSVEKLSKENGAAALMNDTAKLNEQIINAKNNFGALQRGKTVADYMAAQTKGELNQFNPESVRLAFQEIYKSYDVGTNNNSVTGFKVYLDNIIDLALGDSGVTASQGNIFEINDKIQELTHDFNSETFTERVNFINSVYGMIMPWTSLVLNAMLFDANRNEDLALAYETEVANLDNMISVGQLRSDDIAKIKDTKKQLEFYAADARLLADSSNRNVQTLENRVAKLAENRDDALRKVYKEMAQFYDVNKPSVYSYKLHKYFVPFVFNSLVYPGIDNSIAVSGADLMGNIYDKNNQLIKPNSGWAVSMEEMDAACNGNQTPAKYEKCQALKGGDASLWKENNSYNPSVYYMPDKTLKNTFSKHLFSNTKAADSGQKGAELYNKTVVTAEDLKNIKNYSASTDINNPLSKAGFQFMSLDTATTGFKNQCDNYLAGNNNTNCLLSASTVGPVQATPVEAGMYYNNVDIPQKLDSGLYTGLNSQYKSLGWVSAENQANSAEANLWPSEKSNQRQTTAPVWSSDRWWKFPNKNYQNNKYVNNAIQKVNTLDSKLNWQTNQTIAQIYTGQDVISRSFSVSNGLNATYDVSLNYNECKDNGDSNKKCIRYFNTQTVNWLEYRNTDELPKVDEAKIDLSVMPSAKQLVKTIDKDVPNITSDNVFNYYNNYYKEATNSITYYQGLLQLVKNSVQRVINNRNPQVEVGYYKREMTCGWWPWSTCTEQEVWHKTGTIPAFNYGEMVYVSGDFAGLYDLFRKSGPKYATYNGHNYTSADFSNFIIRYFAEKFGVKGICDKVSTSVGFFGGIASQTRDVPCFVRTEELLKQIDGDLSNEAFFLQWSPNDYTKAFYNAYKSIPKMSGTAKAMVVHSARQVSDYLGTDGFNYLQSGKTLSIRIGDAAAAPVASKIFSTFFQAIAGEGWGPGVMVYAGIQVQPIQFQLYPGWKAPGLTRGDFGLKSFWVRGEKVNGKTGTVKYHAEGFTGLNPLTMDLSSVRVRPMIKRVSGESDWQWGGQVQRTAPFAYDFLSWTGLDKSKEYNMMVKVCGSEYASGAWICKDTYTRSTYPSQ
ncbi:MAG: hypothetical protein LBT99_03850 [Bifidobacteriaceae bacterium]|jgi:hypothetical protein|nr:hypothetical protein [Bifidobacteriaceae bacterium]